MKKIKEHKKEKKKWSRKKKIIVGCIIAFLAIGAIAQQTSNSKWESDASDVTNKTRRGEYIEVFDDVLDNKYKRSDLISPQSDDDGEYDITEQKKVQNDEKGYEVNVSTDHVTDLNGEERTVDIWFWISKDDLDMIGDGLNYDLEDATIDDKELTKRKAEKKKKAKEESKESKDSEEATEGDTESSAEEESDDWNSAAEKVTDQDRIATYETAFQTALDDKKANLKYPWGYSDYDMIEKKYTYKGKEGYMVSVTCSKITTSADSDYHTGYMVMWINKDSMDDLSDCVVTLLQFDGESLV